MKKAYKKGFTLIEVLLFVAITAALFVGVAAGTQNSIYQQRFMDSTQNLATFLRSIYTEATNVQSEGGGRSLDKALYGKVVTFETDDNGDNVITMYSLIGDAKKGTNCPGNTPKDKLSCLKANTMALVKNEHDIEEKRLVGYVKDYTMRWNARLQTSDAWNQGWNGAGFSNFEGIMIVTHSPDSGSLFTYVLDKVPDSPDPNNPDQDYDQTISNPLISRNDAIDEMILAIKSQCDGISSMNTCQIVDGVPNPFAYHTQDVDDPIGYYFGDFKSKEIELCVNPDGDDQTDLRRNVRIIEGAHNESGVEIPIDEKEPQTNEPNDNNYNKCK